MAPRFLREARDPVCLDTERRYLEPLMQPLDFEMAAQVRAGRLYQYEGTKTGHVGTDAPGCRRMQCGGLAVF